MMALPALSRRALFILSGFFALILVSVWTNKLSYDTVETEEASGRTWTEKLCMALAHAPQSSHPSQAVLVEHPKYHKVAVATAFGFHHDVYLTVAWTLKRMSPNLGSRAPAVHVYAKPPFTYGFQDVVEELQLYDGVVEDSDHFLDDFERLSGDDAFDMIVLGTCEFDLRQDRDWHKRLLAAWDKRDDAHKFKIVCIIHDVKESEWLPHLPEWTRRNAIRFLPISEHVGKAYKLMMEEMADSADPVIRSAGFEYIQYDTHVPILDIPRLPERKPDHILSNAVIQGAFFSERRDYKQLFKDLMEDLAKDPSVWGYLPLGDQPSYSVDPQSRSPFHLFLIGSGWLEIPTELKNIVSMHVDLTYNQFYKMMGEMDICIPAFAGEAYFQHKASSTFAMALECDVPILVNRRTRATYTYSDDDRAVVTRPAVMREIAAIRALRTNNASDFLEGDPTGTGVPMSANPLMRAAVQDMLARGWQRSKAEFRQFKEDVWRANEEVMAQILRDL
ncbi:hypothetical protein HGRIS_003970 [Hohenbuehelia grisea]|uniref:Glycosyltransferase family 1 protein n=1 Tax=Hohenbuehelia grisea TaxID=104357 RepID=A0ABR3JI30_9AGAR